MKAWIGFFVDRSLLVNLITVAVCGVGIATAFNTTRAVLPTEKIRTVEVHAELPGASAIDVERFVTFRLEEALCGMEDVEEVTSATTNGRTEIAVHAKPYVDSLAPILEKVRSRISGIEYQLPKDLRPIEIKEAWRNTNQWLLVVLVEGVDHKNQEHRIATKILSERLRRIPDVLKVDSTLRDMNLYVHFSREKLARFDLDLTVVRKRIVEYLKHSAIGTIDIGDQDIAVELAHPFSKLSDLNALPMIVNRSGKGIRLQDVATVTYSFGNERVRQRVNGRDDTVQIFVANALGVDAIKISERVREVLANEAPKFLPKGLQARITLDGSEMISYQINALVGNGLGGIVLVLLILMAFLGWRVSLMTAIGLPFSYLGIVLLFPVFDVNFNFVSLVAMILMIGILVDDAIIVSEEFSRQLRAHNQPRNAAISAVLRVAKPVLGMVATTSVAFLPILLVKAERSWMYAPIAIVIIGALFLSLFESFLLLPNHLSHFMPAGYQQPERTFLLVLRSAYKRMLLHVVQFRYVSLVIVIAIVGLATWMLTGPVKYQGIDLEAYAHTFIELKEPATSMESLNKKIQPIESLITELPPDLVDYYSTKLGSAWFSRLYRGWEYAEIRITPPGGYHEQEIKKHQIRDILTPKFRALEGQDFERIRFRNQKGGESRDIVKIYVSGGDRIDFVKIQERIRSTLKKVESIKDIFMEDSRFQTSFRFVPKDDDLLAHGLTKTSLQMQLREHFAGEELLRLRHQGDEIEVFLQPEDSTPPSLEQLEKISVVSAKNVSVPLSFLGRWQSTNVLKEIEHKNLMRLFEVDALYDREKVDPDEIGEAIEKQLAPIRKDFPGYHISVKPSEEEQKDKQWLLSVLITCLLLIYVCLALSLGSLTGPAVVLLAIPFGLTGVVFALYMHSLPLDIMAIIGVAGLAGVVVNDSLVMTSTIFEHFKSDQQAGFAEAVVEGATQRFRAVVLTSVTTLGGVFPLAYGIFGNAGWLRPMVLVLGWGLLFATLLTLFFLPCLLLLFHDAKSVGMWCLKKMGLRQVQRG